jgi:hypothetical protein
MVLWITLKIRIPWDFFAENNLTINDGRTFPIRSTEVESDAASIEVATERHGAFAGFGHVCGCPGLDYQWGTVDFIAHEPGVEGAASFGSVLCADGGGNFGGAADEDAGAPPLPEEEFHQAFDMAQVEGGMFCGVGQDVSLVDGDGSIGAFQSQGERAATGSGEALGGHGPRPEGGRNVSGIEGRNEVRRGQAGRDDGMG